MHNCIAAYSVGDNNETPTELTQYFEFKTSKYDNESREQTIELAFNVSSLFL